MGGGKDSGLCRIPDIKQNPYPRPTRPHVPSLPCFFAHLCLLVPIILLAVIILPQMIRILREYERGVIFRLGKLLGTKGPGLIFLISIVDRMVKMDLRVV